VFAAICCVLWAASCGTTDVSQTAVGPEPVRCELTLDPASAAVAYTASEVSVALRTERDCLWTTKTAATWLTPAPTSGQGDATILLAVAQNTQQSVRTGTVMVNERQVQISQAAAPPPPPPPPAPCSFSLAPASRVFGDRGGNGSVEVQVAEHCAWSASTSAFWISITSATAGAGTATLAYTVDRNFGRLSRTASITIAGQSHLVVQSGLLDVRSSAGD
jgi:hypothetical protein